MFANKVVDGLQGFVIEMSLGNTEFATQNKSIQFMVWFCNDLDRDWIWIGSSIHFGKWISIWMINHNGKMEKLD